MRKLIRDFPDVAEMVLEKCIEVQPRFENQKRLKRYIIEFLEDTYKYKYSLENNDACYIHVTKDKKAKKDSRENYMLSAIQTLGTFFMKITP